MLKKPFVLVFLHLLAFFYIPVKYIYQNYIPLHEHYKDINNKNVEQILAVQRTFCTNSFYLIHHANFGQFKAKQVL